MARLPAVKPRTAKTAKKAADDWFSLIVRSTGFCLRCGESDYGKLETHHIHTRHMSSVRCDFRNAVCFCGSCHRWAHHHGPSFARWLRENWWKDEAEELEVERLAHTSMKVDWFGEVERLAARWKEIEAA